jgi:hypothetical protein
MPNLTRVMHEGMPKVGPRRLDGFRIWVSLPAKATKRSGKLRGGFTTQRKRSER